jgi:hypothetical protein
VSAPPWTCGRCGEGNASFTRFCISCGEARPPACEGCGAELEDNLRFCTSCGRPVAGAAPEASPPVPASVEHRPARRRRTLLVAAFLAAALIVAGIGAAFVFTRGEDEPEEAAPATVTVDREVTVTVEAEREPSPPARRPRPRPRPRSPRTIPPGSRSIGTPALYEGHFTSVDRLQRCYAQGSVAWCTSGPSGQRVKLVAGVRVADQMSIGSRDVGGPSMPMGTSFRTRSRMVRCSSSFRGVTCVDSSGRGFTIGDHERILHRRPVR